MRVSIINSKHLNAMSRIWYVCMYVHETPEVNKVYQDVYSVKDLYTLRLKSFNL